MPAYCAVLKCKSKGSMPERSFFRFPMVNSATTKSLALTQARQQAWITAINRVDLFSSQYKNTTICDLHFVFGRSSHYADVDNVDWVPTLNLGYVKKCEDSEEEESFVASTDNSFQSSKRSVGTQTCASLQESVAPQTKSIQQKSVSAQVNSPIHKSVSVQTERSQHSTGTQTKSIKQKSVSTQTDGTVTGFSTDIFLSYKARIQYLEEMLSAQNVKIENFDGDDTKTKFFTGISSFHTLQILFNYLQPHIPTGSKLNEFQVFIIVLSRLRLNLSFRYLSYQYNVSVPTISTYFHECLTVFYLKLKKFVYWPEREDIRKTMPLTFQKQFGREIVIIIDCFEIFSETPSNIKAAAQMWSQYKHFTTIKYLLGVTPQGFICFISTGFGGRSSDKFICEKSGFFDKLKDGDSVMADRGFLIEEELLHRGVELNIPAFTKGKNQLHPIEIEETRNIANVRIHVERVIGQLRQKFQIIHQHQFPISLIVKRTSSSVNVVDEVVTVCSALSNLCSPIMYNVKK